MKIRIGTFNVNNLFNRASVMQLESFSREASKVLEDVKNLNELLEKDSYEEVKEDILKILRKYFLKKQKKDYFSINNIRGKLYSIKKDKSDIVLIAKGRGDWVGWAELKTEHIDEVCIKNTARVIQAINADILCLVEVENRTTLRDFNDEILKEFNINYPYTMLIDGNDRRGIDIGILSRYPIKSIKSHSDDRDERGYFIFSRDCPEYEIELPDKRSIYMLCNHFKSKGYGNPAENDAKRKKQATRVAEILENYKLEKQLVVVCGDFNDTPKSPALEVLLKFPGLTEVLDSPAFSGERWTFCSGNEQIDFLLVSKPLFSSIQSVAIERRGIHRKGNLSFPEVRDAVTQASDHAAVWTEFEI